MKTIIHNIKDNVVIEDYEGNTYSSHVEEIKYVYRKLYLYFGLFQLVNIAQGGVNEDTILGILNKKSKDQKFNSVDRL